MPENPFDISVRDGNHILTDQEKKIYGKEFETNKMYVLKFLFNDQWNNAGDPRPYRVKTELLDKLAKDAIGKPWVVPEYGETMHIRADLDTAEALLKYQAKFSIGEVKKTIKNPATNNVYGLIEVWPEFHGAVEKNLVPPFVSPTVYNHKEDEDGLIEADFLNIQSVPNPGYPPHLAGITGMCKGGINQCLLELKTLGSAKQLQKTRNDPKLFSNMLKNILGAMSDPNAGAGGGTDPPKTDDKPTELKQVIEKIEEVKTEVTEVKEEVKKVEEMEVKIIEAVAEVATEAEGVDENKIKEILPDTSDTKSDPPKTDDPPSTLGAAGKGKSPELIQVELELKKSNKRIQEMEDEKKREKEAQEAKLRLEHATKIAENMIKAKQITEDKKDETIKFYNELASEDGTLKDISLLATELPKTTEKILGAAGSEYSILTDDSTGTDVVTDDSIMQELKV